MDNQPSFSLAHLSRPSQDRAEGSAPALLLLHGVGSNEQDLMGLAPYLDPRFHVLSARAPIPLGPGMFGWYRIQVRPDGSFLYDEEEARASLSLIQAFIEEAVEAYNLDPDRLFLVGFSQGAIQSCATLLLSPERVAGVVAMSGRWPEAVEGERVPDERLAGKPLLVVHGLYDQVIPIQYGRALKENFSALPVDLTYEEFPMAHSTSAASIQLVDRWLRERLDR